MASQRACSRDRAARPGVTPLTTSAQGNSQPKATPRPPRRRPVRDRTRARPLTARTEGKSSRPGSATGTGSAQRFFFAAFSVRFSSLVFCGFFLVSFFRSIPFDMTHAPVKVDGLRSDIDAQILLPRRSTQQVAAFPTPLPPPPNPSLASGERGCARSRPATLSPDEPRSRAKSGNTLSPESRARVPP